MNEPITENISKKRGRPRAYSDVALAVHAGLPAQSRRGRQNYWHQSTAINVLGTDGQYEWILPSLVDINAGRCRLRQTILQHLGRLLLEEEIKTAARYICDHKLRTAEAIDYLRRFRLRPTKPSHANELYTVLAKAIDVYHETHDVDHDKVLAAIEGLRIRIVEMQEEADHA